MEIAHYNIPIYALKGSRDVVIAIRNVYKDSRGYFISYKGKKTYVERYSRTRFVSFRLTREATMKELYGGVK